MNNKDLIALFEKLYSLGNFKEMIDKMEKVGFRKSQYYNLTSGIVAVHKGYKI